MRVPKSPKLRPLSLLGNRQIEGIEVAVTLATNSRFGDGNRPCRFLATLVANVPRRRLFRLAHSVSVIANWLFLSGITIA
ncbi:MAG: hypothetical protein JWP89_1794 [Schlesneria sp.]|nr:hypothetical protein [Schlesneria sp.]